MRMKTRPVIKGLLAIACVFLAFAIIASGGCGEESSDPENGADGDGARTGMEIPLQTLAHGVTSDYGRMDEMPVPEDTPPECLVIDDEGEFQRLLSLSYFQEPIAEVDFDSYIVIAAMQGPKSTGGYAISIMHASQSDGEVRVEIDLIEPEPGSMTPQVLTSPYHLVLAERSSFDPRGELVFTFVDQDNYLISRQPVSL